MKFIYTKIFQIYGIYLFISCVQGRMLLNFDSNQIDIIDYMIIVMDAHYVQAVEVANQAVIDEWIKYLKVNPTDEWGNKIIDECDWDEEINAVHVAVMRNEVQILKKLVDAGAGSYICIYICTNVIT